MTRQAVPPPYRRPSRGEQTRDSRTATYKTMPRSAVPHRSIITRLEHAFSAPATCHGPATACTRRAGSPCTSASLRSCLAPRARPHSILDASRMTVAATAMETAAEEATNPLYMADEFRMFCCKVLPCSKRFQHDWCACPFAHPNEKARRRCPRTTPYQPAACPDMQQTGSCPRGDACLMTHSVFEYWCHPQRYRTQLCNDGDKCRRKICFFAHNLRELRVPGLNTPTRSSSGAASVGRSVSSASSEASGLLERGDSMSAGLTGGAPSRSSSSLSSCASPVMMGSGSWSPVAASAASSQDALGGLLSGLLAQVNESQQAAALALARAEAADSQLQAAYAALAASQQPPAVSMAPLTPAPAPAAPPGLYVVHDAATAPAPTACMPSMQLAYNMAAAPAGPAFLDGMGMLLSAPASSAVVTQLPTVVAGGVGAHGTVLPMWQLVQPSACC